MKNFPGIYYESVDGTKFHILDTYGFVNLLLIENLYDIMTSRIKDRSNGGECDFGHSTSYHGIYTLQEFLEEYCPDVYKLLKEIAD